MPAPYRDKNILEMSDREREARRLNSNQPRNEYKKPEDRLLKAHRYLKSNYPLAYEAAQIYTPVGMASGALDAIDSASEKNLEGVVQGVLSMVPVLGRTRVGTKIASSAKEAAGVSASATKKETAKKLFKKAGAGENIAEAGEAGYEEGTLRREQLSEGYKRGGSVKAKSFRGDGIAQRGKTKGRMI